jgi:simple sugar transport system ATP-binding protein
MRTLAGVDGARVTAGTLQVNGPIGFIPEDRTTEGVIGEFTLTENLVLAETGARDFVIDWSAARAATDALVRRYDVRPPDAASLAKNLSGGNQQKFVLARALHGAPRVIVAENPTRGLDLLAASAIHARLRDAAAAGAAVFVHSSDLDEVIALATRLFVMTQGTLHELPVDSSRTTIGDAMLGIGSAA